MEKLRQLLIGDVVNGKVQFVWTKNINKGNRFTLAELKEFKKDLNDSYNAQVGSLYKKDIFTNNIKVVELGIKREERINSFEISSQDIILEQAVAKLTEEEKSVLKARFSELL